MAITIKTTSVHWNYFLALEDDLHKLSRYVEFVEANFNCFSLEISRILLAAASEADVVAKQLCLRINEKSTASSRAEYHISEAKRVFSDWLMYAAEIDDTGEFVIFELLDSSEPEVGDVLSHPDFYSMGGETFKNLTQYCDIDVFVENVCGANLVRQQLLF